MIGARRSGFPGKLDFKSDFVVRDGQAANVATSTRSIAAPRLLWPPGWNPFRRDRLPGQPAQCLLIGHLMPFGTKISISIPIKRRGELLGLPGADPSAVSGAPGELEAYILDPHPKKNSAAASRSL